MWYTLVVIVASGLDLRGVGDASFLRLALRPFEGRKKRFQSEVSRLIITRYSPPSNLNLSTQ